MCVVVAQLVSVRQYMQEEISRLMGEKEAAVALVIVMGARGSTALCRLVGSTAVEIVSSASWHVATSESVPAPAPHAAMSSAHLAARLDTLPAMMLTRSSVLSGSGCSPGGEGA